MYTKSRRFIPSEAIPFAVNRDNFTVYFTRNSDETEHQVGVIDSRIEYPAYFKVGSLDLEPQTNYENVYVLSNPNNCVITWLRKSISQDVSPTAKLEWPKTSGLYFARDRTSIISWTGYVNHYSISVEKDPPISGPVHDHLDVLAIDCKASLRSLVGAQLVDLKFDDRALSQIPKALAYSDVINESDRDQSATINLESEIESQLEMSHSTELNSVIDTDWGIHGSLSLGFLAKMLDAKLTISAGYDHSTHKSELSKQGKISLNNEKKIVKYEHVLNMKARTRNRVTLNTEPVSGSLPYTALHKFTYKNADLKWTLDQVQKLMRRQGFRDFNSLYRNGTDVFYSCKGYMEVESGTETHIKIESTPLDADGSSTRTLRILLDPDD